MGLGGQVMIQGQVVTEVEEFNHLGSTIGSDGKRGKEVKKRVQARWGKWK